VRPLHSQPRNGSVEPFSGDPSSPEEAGVRPVSDQLLGQRLARERQRATIRFVRSIQGMELPLHVPDVLIDRIADAVAARIGSVGGSGASPWMDVPAAATYLGTTDDAIRKAAQRGLLPAHQPYGPGSRWFFHRAELDDYILGRPASEASPPICEPA